MTLIRPLLALLWFSATALAAVSDPASTVATRAPAELVAVLRSALVSGNLAPVTPLLTPAAADEVAALAREEAQGHRLATLGHVVATRTLNRRQDPSGTTVTVEVLAEAGSASWTLRFEDAAAKLGHVGLAVASPPAGPVAGQTVAGASAPRSHMTAYGYRRAAPRPPMMPDAAAPPVPDRSMATRPEGVATAPAFATMADDRTVEFLVATTREVADGAVPRFLPVRNRPDQITYGIVRVHAPEDHRVGEVERPKTYGLLGYTLYEEKLDQKRHFVVTGAKLIGEDDFMRFASGDPRREALIFVHGFNNSFEDSAYRFAQILYDLHYQRPAILFAWASSGSVLNYVFDKDSAEIARDRFAALVRTLQARGVEKISVIAHSMGNQLAVAALAQSAATAKPDRVEQLVMAAPDMDAGFLTQIAPALTRVARGITLYACSTDRALQASKRAAGGMVRAGDVPAAGPLVLAGIDTIDVSALGLDWLGLNHDVFATNRSVIDDIGLLLGAGAHPPRLPQVVGMPDGAKPPAWWRFRP